MILGIVTGISAVFLILSWILILRLKSLQSYKNSRLHHRIKNDLQLLVSILNIQGSLASDSSGDGSVEKNLSKAASRVAVMALIHQAMQKSSKPGFFDGIFFARELCKSLSGRYPGIPYQVKGCLFLKDEESAVTGLFMNEVIDNAFKFYRWFDESPGFEDTGVVISLEGNSGTECRISVSNPGGYFEESSVPDKTSVPNMGLMLARTLSGQLKGSFKIESLKKPEGQGFKNTVTLEWKSAGQNW